MSILRVFVLPAIAFPVCLAAMSPAPGEAPRKPNVLLILTDDQGYGDLSLHGNPHLKTPNLDKLGQAGVRFERFYVNSFCAPTEVALTRRAIAMCYASGGHLIVPWDVYTGSNSPRYYGKPEQYADLYKFVRDHSQLIDGHEDAAFLLPGLTDKRYPADPPMSLSDAGDLAAVARAVPGKPQAPVVIHLVDWREKPQPITMKLLSRRFVSDGLLQAELLRPGRPVAQLDCRTADTHTLIEIPPLAPWGIVVVNPANGK
jgi:hypothetical protein